jgi:acetoacetyl-CoA synthetase
MSENYELTDEIVNNIKTTIRTNASPRHVPAVIVSVPDIPYTHNMKKVELAVNKVIHNQPVLNKDSLKNPESLDYFADLKALQED